MYLAIHLSTVNDYSEKRNSKELTLRKKKVSKEKAKEEINGSNSLLLIMKRKPLKCYF